MPIFHVKCVKIYTGQKNLHWRRQPRQWQLSGMGFNSSCPKILEQWSKAKTVKENEEVVKKIDLDKMDLVEKMSQITQVRQKRGTSFNQY